jgi:predicted amidohydrolase
MDVRPAPTAERLERAATLAEAAAQAGARLIVLPEVFNTGYIYTDANHRLAEPPDGPTVQWLKATAAHLNVHLAGSLLLCDQGEIFNALLLIAPDGRLWRYDKNYPWGWERGYFRAGRSTAAGRFTAAGKAITIAQTDLGAIGLLICWDIAHLELWRRYAGQVDLMVVASSPPDITNGAYRLPDGSAVTMSQMGPALSGLQTAGCQTFVELFAQQAAWLGAPVAAGGGGGQFQTPVPHSQLTLLGMLPLAPHLARYLPQTNALTLEAAMLPTAKLLNAQGQIVAAPPAAPANGWAAGELTLAAARPQPHGPQPRSPLSGLVYFIADRFLPTISLSTYRRGIKGLS